MFLVTFVLVLDGNHLKKSIIVGTDHLFCKMI
jgi:hypothetical protein